MIDAILLSAIIAAISATVGSIVMGTSIVALEDYLHESKEEFRFQAREGFTVTVLCGSCH